MRFDKTKKEEFDLFNIDMQREDDYKVFINKWTLDNNFRKNCDFFLIYK